MYISIENELVIKLHLVRDDCHAMTDDDSAPILFIVPFHYSYLELHLYFGYPQSRLICLEGFDNGPPSIISARLVNDSGFGPVVGSDSYSSIMQ